MNIQTDVYKNNNNDDDIDDDIEPENIIDNISLSNNSVSDNRIVLKKNQMMQSNNDDELTDTDDELTETDDELTETDDELTETDDELTETDDDNDDNNDNDNDNDDNDDNDDKIDDIDSEDIIEEDIKKEIKPKKILSTNEMINVFYKLKRSSYGSNICVICKKEGGIKFINNNGLLKATCNSSTPCRLNIEIQKGKIVQLRDLENDLHKKINEHKNKMILLKLDLLFGYTDEEKTIELFKTNNKLLSDYERLLYECHNYIGMMDKEKETTLNEYRKLFEEKINNIKELTSIFEKTKEHGNIKEIVKDYVDNIYPLLEKIRKEKYHKMDTVYDENSNANEVLYRLVQDEFKMEETEMYIGDETKVISFIK